MSKCGLLKNPLWHPHIREPNLVVGSLPENHPDSTSTQFIFGGMLCWTHPEYYDQDKILSPKRVAVVTTRAILEDKCNSNSS